MQCKYRIGVIDDFRNEFSFIDYRDYGELQVWNAATVGGPRKRQHRHDRICVFLNFFLIGAFTERGAATAEIRRLLAEAPVSLEEFAHHVLPDTLAKGAHRR